MKKIFLKNILIGIFIFGIAFYLGGVFKGKETTKVSLEEASKKAIDYINKYLLRENFKATLVDKTQDPHSGLYKIKFKVQNQEFEGYISQNGKYLFFEGIDLTISPQEKALANIPKKETPEVFLFVMSYCPFGNQAEKIIYPVVNLLKDYAKIEPHYVIYQNYMGGSSEYCLENGKYCSMHGIEELKQDLRELCIFKYQKEKFWDYLIEVNEKCNLKNIATCWEKIAKKHQIDIEKIKNCQENEAISLLEKEVALNKKYQITGSPTLLINGTVYQGQRTPEAYKQAICAGFKTPPSECQKKLENTSNAPAGTCK